MPTKKGAQYQTTPRRKASGGLGNKGSRRKRRMAVQSLDAPYAIDAHIAKREVIRPTWHKAHTGIAPFAQ